MVVNVLVVCTFGLGSSVMYRSALAEFLEKKGVDAHVEMADLPTVKARVADVIVTLPQFEKTIKDSFPSVARAGRVIIHQSFNFRDIDFFEKRILPVVKEVEAEKG